MTPTNPTPAASEAVPTEADCQVAKAILLTAPISGIIDQGAINRAACIVATAHASELAALREEVERLTHTVEAYRKRARKLYTPATAATKIAEDEARMRDVDRQLEEAIGVLKWYGLEIVHGAEEGATLLMTKEDAKGVRDGVFVKPIAGGLYAGDQSELKLLREDFDAHQKEFATTQAEVERLRQQLSEAKADGFSEGEIEAALDDQTARDVILKLRKRRAAIDAARTPKA